VVGYKSWSQSPQINPLKGYLHRSAFEPTGVPVTQRRQDALAYSGDAAIGAFDDIRYRHGQVARATGCIMPRQAIAVVQRLAL
jgi:hypothetical protein